jgi:Ribonuclease G/E
MLAMVQEARKDKLIMKEVGENASTADIARYLDKNQVAGENIRNRVRAKKAREIANADETFAKEIGADAYTIDANEAVIVAKKLLGK